jgi:ABC-2 type transport system permease protein
MMGHAIRVYAEMRWRRLRRGRIIIGSLVIALLPAAVAAIAAAKGRWGSGLFNESLEMYFRLLLPLAPILLASAAVGEEVDANTHTYLFARPAPRAAIVLGKSLTSILAIMPAFLVGVGMCFLVAVVMPAALSDSVHAADIDAAKGAILPALGAIALGVPVYTGVAAGIGTLFVRRPLLGGMLYILLFEWIFASLPGALKIVSINFYLRAVAGLLPDTTTVGGIFRIWEPHPDAWVAIIVAIALGAGYGLLGMWLVTDAEYRESAK